MSDDTTLIRALFAQLVSARAAVTDPRITEAFTKVPREPFAGPGPWHLVCPLAHFSRSARYSETPDANPAYLYQDVLIALDKERHLNIGEPSLHAFCLDHVRVRRGEHVIQIGTGSGYYTAILADLCGPEGQVDGYEIDPGLAAKAAAQFDGVANVTIHPTSGLVAMLPPADVIYVCAAATHLDPAWLTALKPGGRLLVPLHGLETIGGMLLITRPPTPSLGWPARFITSASFYPLSGLQNPEIGRRLLQAYMTDTSWQQVTALRFDAPVADQCWYQDTNWWLAIQKHGALRTAA